MTVKMTTDPEGYPNFTPQQWADKLRSGAYIQANRYWYDAPQDPRQPEKHCCLAVLATEMGWDVERNGEIDAAEDWVGEWLRQNKLPEVSIFVGWNDGITAKDAVISLLNRALFGIPRPTESAFAVEPHTFSQIADKIEEHL